MIVRFLPVPSNALSFPAAPFGRAVTVSGLSVLSTTWKSTDGTASHWKYIVDNVIVYRDVYRENFPQTHQDRLNFAFARDPGAIRKSRSTSRVINTSRLKN